MKGITIAIVAFGKPENEKMPAPWEKSLITNRQF